MISNQTVSHCVRLQQIYSHGVDSYNKDFFLISQVTYEYHIFSDPTQLVLIIPPSMTSVLVED
jgi:hypothetical protein